jgi:hypothetical protein
MTNVEEEFLNLAVVMTSLTGHPKITAIELDDMMSHVGYWSACYQLQTAKLKV